MPAAELRASREIALSAVDDKVRRLPAAPYRSDPRWQRIALTDSPN